MRNSCMWIKNELTPSLVKHTRNRHLFYKQKCHYLYNTFEATKHSNIFDWTRSRYHQSYHLISSSLI